MDVTGEHRYNHAPRRLGKHFIKGLADLQFAHRVAGPLHVRGFAQEGHDTFLSVLGKGLQVGNLPVDRRVVHLEVAAADNRSRRAGNRNRAGAGDGMAHVNKLTGKLAQLDHIPGPDHVHRDPFHPVFLQLQVHQRHGQLGPVNMSRRLPQDIGRRADMILMAVGKQITADMIPLPHQIGDVRNHKVHAQHIFLGKNTAAVHHNDVVFIFENIHVLADLIHTAEGDDPQSAGLFFLCLRAHREPPFIRINIENNSGKHIGHSPAHVFSQTI